MSASLSAGDSEQGLKEAAAHAASHLAALQSSEGLWPNLLVAGSYLDVLYAVGTWFLGHKDHPLQPPCGEAWARRVLAGQNPDGGFPLWHGGPSDPRYGIETYLALRLAGVPASDPGLRALGRTIAKAGGLAHGGAIAWTKLLWAGAARSQAVPAGAPEYYYSLQYERWPAIMRQEVVCHASLSVADYLRGAPQPPPASELPSLDDELPPPELPPVGFDLRSWRGALFARWARVAPRALRDPIVFRVYDAVIREALRWPVLSVALYAALAVRAAGGRGSETLAQFERVISLLGPLSPAEPPRPCDYGTRTAALAALALAGIGAPQGLERTAKALLERFHPASPGSNHGALSAGWAQGDLHGEPDAETTALVLLALRRVGVADAPPAAEAAAALAAAQRKDGGWSAHPDEPSSPDITGSAIEALTAWGHAPSSDPVRRAVRFLESSQHAEAWWRGARGICRLFGTAMALRGLRAADINNREAAVLRAGEWIRSIQNADGGWGEDPKSHDEGLFREGPSTPAHTAWALLGLLAGGDPASESVRRGFAWLSERQKGGGGWESVIPTMPGVAYAPYLMDPLGSVAWPMLAIGERLGSAA